MKIKHIVASSAEIFGVECKWLLELITFKLKSKQSQCLYIKWESTMSFNYDYMYSWNPLHQINYLNVFLITSNYLNSEDSDYDIWKKKHIAMIDVEILCCFYMHNMVAKRLIIYDEGDWCLGDWGHPMRWLGQPIEMY